MITLWETFPHYRRHLWPIAAELHRRDLPNRYVKAPDQPTPDRGGILVTAAYRDLARRQNGWKARVLVEHGIGQSYQGSTRGRNHPAYSNGVRIPYDLLISPGAHCQDRSARAHVFVGCLPTVGFERRHAQPEPTVGFVWHWPCTIAPEAGTAYWSYRTEVESVTERLLHEGWWVQHGRHPRWGDDAPIVRDGSDLLAMCDVLVVDNSSLMFEAARLDIPVVVVNDPSWRRTIEHGKRFWEWADVGEQVDHPAELGPAIERAHIVDPNRLARKRVTNEAYADVRDPTGTAVEAILALL